MKNWFYKILNIGLATGILATANAQQDTVRYTGNTLVNVDYHHGQLVPAVGVHNIQAFRANREHGDWAGTNWTYNHQPMLAYWNNQFYLEFLSNPVGEHVPPGQTFLCTSKDGYTWSKPTTVFPLYKIPDGIKKPGQDSVTRNTYAVNHQRMGFFVSKRNRLMALAYYGIVMGKGDDPNDGRGIGRVIREIYKDGSFGRIYFIRNNKWWDKSKSNFPFYTSSKDKGFVEACNEILSNPLETQQWVEEADRDDELLSLKNENLKAFSYYHLPDGRVVGLWKNALTDMSKDNGKTWLYNPTRAPKFVNSNAKIWGQRTSDGKYATVYNPSEFRWPLAISVSDDGLHYKNLLLVNGEITSMRYGGAYKSYGPQYVRGITEGDGTPPDGNLWVTYSMNKEDIWVASIPVPVTDKVSQHVNETFNQMADGQELKYWNYNSGLWTPVTIAKMQDGTKALSLQDWDPFDYAKAERIIPASKKLTAEFTVVPQQNSNGMLDIEFQDAKGTPGIRLAFDSTGNFTTKAGYRIKNLQKFNAGETYKIKVELNTDQRFYTVDINGKKSSGLFFAPLEGVERIVFRTGGVRRYPNADTPTDQDFDLPNGGEQDKKAVFYITSFKTSGSL
jgi:hypothetical protein